MKGNERQMGMQMQHFEGFGSETHLLCSDYPISHAGDLPKLVYLPA
jgi:hypothetical protein